MSEVTTKVDVEEKIGALAKCFGDSSNAFTDMMVHVYSYVHDAEGERARAEKAENESRILGKLLDESMSDLEGGVSPSEVIARVKRYRFLRVKKETER